MTDHPNSGSDNDDDGVVRSSGATQQEGYSPLLARLLDETMRDAEREKQNLDETIREKEAFLAEATENNFILFYEHDPVIECSRVVQTEKGFRASDTMSLADILRVEE